MENDILPYPPKGQAVGYVIEYTLTDGYTSRSRMFENEQIDKYAHIDAYMSLLEDVTVATVKTYRVMPDGTEKFFDFYVVLRAMLKNRQSIIRREDLKRELQEKIDTLDKCIDKQVIK